MNIEEATKGDLTDLARRAFELWQRLPVERTERRIEDGSAGERGRERVQKQWADPSEVKEANDGRRDFLGFGQAGEIRTTVRNDDCQSRLFSESKRWGIEIVEMVELVELVEMMETVSTPIPQAKDVMLRQLTGGFLGGGLRAVPPSCVGLRQAECVGLDFPPDGCYVTRWPFVNPSDPWGQGSHSPPHPAAR
ncbi:hypothetical protein PAAG_05206 [Paracoccidioides lutzii Pb01]|uniref:Uncharacterized protein n=1 Tax=Paracoccidioides lutzii (strain ATCC MYA-826 / Pb01) TaxID=502779 RepID=C1H363_PARBA|nr:hypothetical protein PAAG_05206 [Paracoccidioides lutzii Pb01]EEH34157.2 hypothetical protein PAAG_05206 [Paracoccidioides lutzii Pb01]